MEGGSMNFHSVLQSWQGQQVTVINPESFRSTALKESLGFQAYGATISEVGDDFIKLSYTAQKKGQDENVEQWIPLGMIKRITIQGNERFLHI
jgi:hypothetical protein